MQSLKQQNHLNLQPQMVPNPKRQMSAPNGANPPNLRPQILPQWCCLPERSLCLGVPLPSLGYHHQPQTVGVQEISPTLWGGGKCRGFGVFSPFLGQHLAMTQRCLLGTPKERRFVPCLGGQRHFPKTAGGSLEMPGLRNVAGAAACRNFPKHRPS